MRWLVTCGMFDNDSIKLDKILLTNTMHVAELRAVPLRQRSCAKCKVINVTVSIDCHHLIWAKLWRTHERTSRQLITMRELERQREFAMADYIEIQVLRESRVLLAALKIECTSLDVAQWEQHLIELSVARWEWKHLPTIDNGEFLVAIRMRRSTTQRTWNEKLQSAKCALGRIGVKLERLFVSQWK